MYCPCVDADAYRAISDPTRRAVLDLLAERPRTVSELLVPFPMTQPEMSQHLRVLRDAGLVRAEKQGRNRIYQIDAEPLRRVHDLFGRYVQFWLSRLQRLGEWLERDEAASRLGE